MPSDERRLTDCGWTSFDVGCFLNEPGRLARDEGDEFLTLLREHSPGPRVLELCCGAGRLALALACSGHEVTGLDLDPRMLAVAGRNVEHETPETQARLRLRQADVCGFDLAERFDFVILEDDGFVYLLTQEDQLACLGCVRRHLAKGGRFLLRFETPWRELEAGGEFEYDPLTQIKTSPCDWTTTDVDGSRGSIRQGFERRRLTYPQELHLLLRCSGLRLLHVWSGPSQEPLVDPRRQAYCLLIGTAEPER